MAAKGRVDTPTPQPPRVGLLASANNVVVDSDMEPNSTTRWIEGFAWVPAACDAGGIIDPCAVTSTAAPTNEELISVTPFVVEGVDNCTVFSQGTDATRAYHQQLAHAQLLACEQKMIEHELWAGTLTEAAGTGNKYLTDGDADLPEGTKALGYVTALAVLEHAIADGSCGERGVIHARADTVTMWASASLVTRAGNLLLTALDTIVVPGRGYTGSLSGGPVLSTDSAWAFATSIVQVRRGVITDLEPRIDRTGGNTANNLTSRSQRFAAATWGCLHAGVHVLHTEATTVSGS